MKNAVNFSKKNIAAYAGLADDNLICMSVKNSAEICTTGHHEKGSLPIFTRTGRKNITPEEYMDIVEACQPDMFHALCDGDTQEHCSNKRAIKAVERTDNFSKCCIERHKNSDRLKNSMLIVPIEGGYNTKVRQHAIKNVLKLKADGYLIDGLHANGAAAARVDMRNIEDVVRVCTDSLPPQTLKIMLGSYHPITMMALIKFGIDVFDSSYVYLATINNCALAFEHDLNAFPKSNLAFDLDISDPM